MSSECHTGTRKHPTQGKNLHAGRKFHSPRNAANTVLRSLIQSHVQSAETCSIIMLPGPLQALRHRLTYSRLQEYRTQPARALSTTLMLTSGCALDEPQPSMAQSGTFPSMTRAVIPAAALCRPCDSPHAVMMLTHEAAVCRSGMACDSRAPCPALTKKHQIGAGPPPAARCAMARRCISDARCCASRARRKSSGTGHSRTMRSASAMQAAASSGCLTW